MHLAIVLLVLCLNQAHSLYFHVDETTRKCFTEEIPDETTVLASYKVEPFDPESNGYVPSKPDTGMYVQIKDPDEKILLSRIYKGEGRISFTSHIPGDHTICLYNDNRKNSAKLRVHFDIKIGDQAIDYAEVAKKEKFSDLQLRIRQLLDQVEQIMKEQDYQRYREERFRAVSESTNKRILWWSILHVSIVVTIGFWQMRHLRKFFEAKKLV